jgi:GT2 family glycosyltransferase
LTNFEEIIKVSVVIPTLNRPLDLIAAIESICLQTLTPHELAIIDQSPLNDSKELTSRLMLNFPSIDLIYIHDVSITGLVNAKKVAVENVTGDIVFFLEDDIILEYDYIEQIKNGFVKHPYMIGCSGVITNPPNKGIFYKFLFHLFHRGIFRDIRVSIYGKFNGRNNSLIESNKLSGGVSAWRREVFYSCKFDVKNGFHMFEDIDFSTNVARVYGPRLFINPNARLEHNFSPINRLKLGARERQKLIECITFYKKRVDWPWAKISLIWLLFGMLLDATVCSLRFLSFHPIKGYFTGIQEGLIKKIIHF